MKTTLWTLPLLVALAACSRAPENNAAASNNAAPANGTAAATPPANSTAAPAQQAMPPGLDCVRNRLSPEQRRAVGQLAAERGSRDDPRAQPLVQAVDACAAELSWSQQKRRFAGMFSMSAAGLAALQEELTGQGLALAELDQAIESDEPLMTAANAGDLGTAGQEFAQRHAALLERLLGDRLEDRQLAVRVGNYIGFRAMTVALANRFAQEP
jgi:hypothetical protein